MYRAGSYISHGYRVVSHRDESHEDVTYGAYHTTTSSGSSGCNKITANVAVSAFRGLQEKSSGHDETAVLPTILLHLVLSTVNYTSHLSKEKRITKGFVWVA
jgi:hypothetical protein